MKKCSRGYWVKHFFFFLLRPSTPTINYLPWQITHSLLVYIQSLTTASWSWLFGSVVRASDFYPGRPGLNSTIGGTFFQLFIPLLRLSCRKMEACPGSDFTLPKMASCHHTWWLPWKCYGLSLLLLIICLGRFCIACRHIFNLWQLCHGVDALVQWLEHWIFIRADRVQIPRSAEHSFVVTFMS